MAMHPLAFTLHTIRREDRERGAEERPAILRWTEPDGTSVSQGIQIRTSGRFRPETRNCDLPPLRQPIPFSFRPPHPYESNSWGSPMGSAES